MVKSVFEEIDLENIKGVLIDLDDTLYPYQLNHERSMLACINQCKSAYNISEQQFNDYFKPSRETVHHQLYGQAASHSRLLYFQKFGEKFFGYTNPAFSLDMEELYWSEFLSGMAFFPEAELFLKTLKEMNIKTCIVTDLTAQIQLRKWNKLKLGRYVDFMVSSEEAGIEKPDALIFEMALSKLGLEASQVIMIGDNETKDIAGSKALGIRSYLVNKQE